MMDTLTIILPFRAVQMADIRRMANVGPTTAACSLDTPVQPVATRWRTTRQLTLGTIPRSSIPLAFDGSRRRKRKSGV